MPSYQYKCDACEITQTETFSIKVELPSPLCPKCQEPMLRVFSVASVQFKGSGWGRDKN